MTQHDKVETREITLKRVAYGCQQYLDNESCLFDASFDLERSVMGGMIASIRGYVWAEHIDDYQRRWPADWWQHFKERWFPAWALKRWPVRYDGFDIERIAVYPEFKAVKPHQQHYIHVNATSYNPALWTGGDK